LRVEYVREFGGTIDEGIQALTRAMELKSEYDDAMVYLNLCIDGRPRQLNPQRRETG